MTSENVVPVSRGIRGIGSAITGSIRSKRPSLIFSGLLLLVASCGTGSNSDSDSPALDSELIEAVGIWELGHATVKEGVIHVQPARVGSGIFAAVVTSDPSVDPMNCNYGPYDNVTDRVSVLRFESKEFTEVSTFEVKDEWVAEAMFSDLTKDGAPELAVVGSTRCSGVVGFTLKGEVWEQLPPTGATQIRNGVLISTSKDYQPDGASGGVITESLEWNGTAFVAAGPVDQKGKKVNLSITQTCPEYVEAKSLPLKMCDSGTLVNQFINLAKNVIGDYEAAPLLPTDDRFTPELARWVKTYRYRHGDKYGESFPVVAEINGEMFKVLGDFWNPQPGQENVFTAYSVTDEACMQTQSVYDCWVTRYYFPTEECAEYRVLDMQTFPLKLCDVGLWVRWVLNELEEFDQVSSASLPSVLTKEVQMRVKAYQRRNSLEVDGLVGPATWRKMFGRGQCYDGDYGGNGDGVCGPGDNPPD